MLEHLPTISTLAPGLYEMRISFPTGDPSCSKDQYAVTFEPRRVEELQFAYPKAAFDAVRCISEFNEAWYKAMISPWVKLMSNPLSALVLHWLHPMRLKTALFSEAFIPPMAVVASLAQQIEKERHALPSSNPLIVWEGATLDAAVKQTEFLRHVRDAAIESAFLAVYGWAGGKYDSPSNGERKGKPQPT